MLVSVYVAGLAVSALAMAGVLALSIWQRKSHGERRFNALEYVIEMADEDDIAIMKIVCELREFQLLIEEGDDR